MYGVGNRDFDEVYVKIIKDSSVHYFDINPLRQTGIENCCRSFLQMIDQHRLDGFWIHLDADVLDDEIMPAVDSREKGGLSYEELKEILACLLSSDKSAGIEITILDPDLDKEGVYTKRFVEEIAPLIKKKKA